MAESQELALWAIVFLLVSIFGSWQGIACVAGTCLIVGGALAGLAAAYTAVEGLDDAI